VIPAIFGHVESFPRLTNPGHVYGSWAKAALGGIRDRNKNTPPGALLRSRPIPHVGSGCAEVLRKFPPGEAASSHPHDFRPVTSRIPTMAFPLNNDGRYRPKRLLIMGSRVRVPPRSPSKNQILSSEKTQPTPKAKIEWGSERGNEIVLVDGPTGRSPSTKCAHPVLAAVSTS
jgi:hypothetical protein